MSEKPSVFANPLAGLGYDDAALLSPGAFSAVCARPGVGKTAFLVQLALWALSLEKNVLHVSLSDPIKKVDLWYQDLFANLAGRFKIYDVPTAWSVFLPHRFIMAFKVEGFSVPKLEERMNDLMEQQIFVPRVMLLDGLISDTSLRVSIDELKSLAKRHSLPVWFSVKTQQYPMVTDEHPFPSALHESADAFESIVSIEGAAGKIHVRRVKGGSEKAHRASLRLDPSTLLLTIDDAP